MWKFRPAGVKRQMERESPWGRGFPGWHIECSAMSAKFLGTWFDIHCGGEDHIAVHHNNEIARTQAVYGARLANFWMHGHFLTLDANTKMSKFGRYHMRPQRRGSHQIKRQWCVSNGLHLIQLGAGARDFRQDVGSFCRPDERFRITIVLLDVLFNGAHEFGYRAKGFAP